MRAFSKHGQYSIKFLLSFTQSAIVGEKLMSHDTGFPFVIVNMILLVKAFRF